MNFECISSVFFNLQKSTLNAICGVPEHLAILLFAFDAWLWRYLSWPDIFWRLQLAFRSWLWTLFVVAGHRLLLHAFLQKSTLNAICGVPEHLAILLFAFDAWFWCYLWCSKALGHFIVCLRCLTLMLFVVAGHTFGGQCFSSMLDFDAICRGRKYF